MGSGASVVEHDPTTFAIIHREYERLRSLQADDHDDSTPLTDEVMFMHIRDVLLQHSGGFKTARELEVEVDAHVEVTAETVAHLDGADDHDESEARDAVATDVSTPAATPNARTSSPATLAALHENRSFASRSNFDLTQNLTPIFTTDVLTDPTTFKMTLNYAERNKIPHGVDMLRFWVEIDELSLLPSHSYTNRRLHKIYDKFLSPEAPSPVCVTSSMLSEIEKALEGENIHAGIFAEAQAICYTALEKSVYPRFRESKLFRKMQEFCAPSGPKGQQQSAADAEDYSLMGILSHPAKLRFLKSFCMEALALENLLFYLEVEDCKRLPNLSFIANKTRKIYDRYCVTTSRNALGLDDETVLKELHATVEKKQPITPKLFYEAQLVIFNRISEEIWRGFCRTQEYLDYSRKLKPDKKHTKTPVSRFTSSEQTEQAQKKLEGMNEFQLIECAMHYPVVKLIPIEYRPGLEGDGASMVLNSSMTEQQLTPEEQLTMILSDPFAKKYFKQFMKKRCVDQYLAFCEECEDFKLLPGIEYLQHSAKKIYRKYIIPSAKLQVDMSTAMRDEISDKLLTPTVDMFKKISMRVRHGMLQDSLPRFVKSTQYGELKKQAKQTKDTALESELNQIDAAAKRGKLELSHLDILIQNQLCIKLFRSFLESQHCSENLMLWEEIEHFRRLPSYQIVLRSAKKIYDKYLNPGNMRNAIIQLPEALHGRVVSQLDIASRTTFDEVEKECHEYMRNVVVPDFLDSRIFMALVGTWSVVDDDYPAEMLRGEFEMAFLRHRFHLVQELRGLSRDTSTPLSEKQNSHATSISSH